MRPLWLALCVGVIAAGSGTAQQRIAPGSGTPLTAFIVEAGRIERLERWMKAVARHVPGMDDDPLADIAGWANRDLKALWIDANVLTQMVRNPRAAAFNVRGEGQRAAAQVRYTATDLHRLHVLACVAGGMLVEPECMREGAANELDPEFRQMAVLARATRVRGDNNYLLRRGAILHSDIAILAPASMIASGPVVARPSGGPERFRMEISDGQELDLQQSAVHWEIARMLLDFIAPRDSVKPSPGNDAMVRQWYRATAAWMQWKEDHDKLHLEHARALFPADADMLFLSACQRETYAGAPIQTAVRSAILPTGVVIDVGSDHGELREAEALFRRALDVRSDFAEARLRYGRVLDLLGKHAEAAAELRKAIGGLTDRQMLYYGGMFLGSAEEALGNRDAARVAYDQSAALYPMAQSPLLALSQLARRSGDRRGALQAIDRLFALPGGDRSEQDDPWWGYYIAQGREAETLLDVMQQPYRSEVLQ